MMMRSLIFFVVLSVTVGCGKQVTDWALGGGRRPGDDSDVPSESTSRPIGIKISPGANSVAGSQVQSRFAITPSQRTASGSNVKSKFTFHQNRPE